MKSLNALFEVTTILAASFPIFIFLCGFGGLASIFRIISSRG